MNISRRRFLAAALIGNLSRATARPAEGAPLSAQTEARRRVAASSDFREAWSRETGGVAVLDSKEIDLNVPAVAEDGTVVPVAFRSRIASTERMVLFVERNPFPFIAAFDLREGIVPTVSFNIKMNESSAVIVVVRAAGKFFRTDRYVRVVHGGCGDSTGQDDTNR